MNGANNPTRLLRSASATRQQKDNSTKRSRNNSNPSSPDSNHSKRVSVEMPKDTITYDRFEALLAKQTDSIKSIIAEEVKTQCEVIAKKFTDEIHKINNRVTEFESKLTKEMETLHAKVDSHTNNAHTDDDLQRFSKLNELKMTGIGTDIETNLQQVFESIAKVINFDTTNQMNTPSLKRIYKRSNVTGSESVPLNTVIVKFVAKHIRDDFYSKYLGKIASKQPITSASIGLNTASASKIIMISENLTAHNAKIFAAIAKEKRTGKVSQIYTHDGIVYAKANKSDTKGQPIRTMKELEIYRARIEAMDTGENSNQ